jgi:opacity protein-like surface antigen
MSSFSGRLALALVLVTPALGGRTAHAQAAPLTYWTPGWPVGFSDVSVDETSNTYGKFPGFDGRGARAGGFSYARYNFPNNWFVGSERGAVGLSMSGINQGAGFGNFGSLYTEGMQLGYSFKNSGLPLTIYAGFDTLKYNTGLGSPFAPFDATSGTLPGYSAHAGVEIQPTSNLSLSLGVGYTQQSGRMDSDINSLSLPGASPFGLGGRR